MAVAVAVAVAVAIVGFVRYLSEVEENRGWNRASDAGLLRLESLSSHHFSRG